jgi:hypothetical protein
MNANGRRDAGEGGVAGIIIVLDGIQAVRTDDGGSYRFEAVADGAHRVTVNADSLPLPWSIRSENSDGVNGSFAKSIEIEVRSTTQLDIAAQKE